MPFAVNLTFGPDPHAAIQRLRYAHLGDICGTLDQILAGGSVRGDDGTLDEDIIILRTDERSAAEAWGAAEPFSASARCSPASPFARGRRWSRKPTGCARPSDRAFAPERQMISRADGSCGHGPRETTRSSDGTAPG